MAKRKKAARTPRLSDLNQPDDTADVLSKHWQHLEDLAGPDVTFSQDGRQMIAYWCMVLRNDVKREDESLHTEDVVEFLSVIEKSASDLLAASRKLEDWDDLGVAGVVAKLIWPEPHEIRPMLDLEEVEDLLKRTQVAKASLSEHMSNTKRGPKVGLFHYSVIEILADIFEAAGGKASHMPSNQYDKTYNSAFIDFLYGLFSLFPEDVGKRFETETQLSNFYKNLKQKRKSVG